MFKIMQSPSELVRLILIGVSVFGIIRGSEEECSLRDFDVHLNFTAVGLKNLANGFVRNKFVTHITLDDNQLSSIPSGAFSFTPKLSYLSLARNNLSTLDLSSFAELHDLDTLVLNGNCKASMETQHRIVDYEEYGYYWPTPSPVFQRSDSCNLIFSLSHRRLTHLFVENNDIKNLVFDSGDLPMLTQLYLSHNPIEFDRETMIGLNRFMPALTHLYVQDCGIEEWSAFSLPNLTSLYLDNNKIVRIENHSDSVSCLNLVAAQKLRVLSVSHNQIGTISADSFIYATNLRMLDLSYNEIYTIPIGTFDGLRGLQFLSLEHNAFLQLDSVDMFMGLSNLETLLLGGTKILGDMSNLMCGPFADLPALKILMLNSTRINNICPEMFSNLTSLEVLSLAGNQLSRIPEGFLATCDLLITLDLNDNNFASTNDIPLINQTHLASLSLINNPLTSISARWIMGIGSENLTITVGRSYPK